VNTAALDPWPYLSADVPAVPAAVKRRYEDFFVDEIPAYEPSGRGDHVYFVVEKRGLATMPAAADIARALGRNPRDIGFAGLKDARAVTRQTFSVEHEEPERIRGLDLPRMRVLSVSRHTNKLRIGHLRGNRFAIRLREVDPGRIDDIRAVLDLLSRRGTPNYFGRQRFGTRGDSGRIGAALLHDDPAEAMALLCGRAGEFDTGEVRRARRLYDAGNFAAAARAWPYLFRDAARACRAMAKSDGDARRAIRAVPRGLRQFFVSACQSWLFNRVLAARIDEIDRVRPGDLAYKHDNGAVFLVQDAAAEQPRAERFEISPTGPLFGRRMTAPADEPAASSSASLPGSGSTRRSSRPASAPRATPRMPSRTCRPPDRPLRRPVRRGLCVRGWRRPAGGGRFASRFGTRPPRADQTTPDRSSSCGSRWRPAATRPPCCVRSARTRWKRAGRRNSAPITLPRFLRGARRHGGRHSRERGNPEAIPRDGRHSREGGNPEAIARQWA